MALMYTILTVSFTPLITAYGLATVANQCPFPINAWVVSSTQGPMLTIPSGGEYAHTYETNTAGGGISIKLTPDPYITDPITQFEYTLAGSENYYDISNVNGSPFMPYGLTLTSSDPSCAGVICKANSTCSTMVYNQPNDNFATHACDSGADLTLTLCDGSALVQNAPAAMPTSLLTPLSAASMTSVAAATTTQAQPTLSLTSVPATTTTQTPASTMLASVSCDTTMQILPTTFRTSVLPAITTQTPTTTSASPNVDQPAWPVAPGVSIATTFVTRIQTFTDAITEVVTATVT